jgi:HEAT repeat protein
MGGAAREAVPDLRMALQDEDWWVRQEAAVALRKIGEA